MREREKWGDEVNVERKDELIRRVIIPLVRESKKVRSADQQYKAMDQGKKHLQNWKTGLLARCIRTCRNRHPLRRTKKGRLGDRRNQRPESHTQPPKMHCRVSGSHEPEKMERSVRSANSERPLLKNLTYVV